MAAEDDMAVFVLVHGGSHGGWCWDKVVPLLEADGHRAIAPDLPGMGDDPTPIEKVTLARWAERIAAVAIAQNEPVILVGHSRGGPVIGEAAEIAPEAVQGLIYLTALLLPAGTKVLEVLLADNPEQLAALVRSGAPSVTIDPQRAKAMFYNRCDPADVDWAISKLCPEPVGPNLTPLTVSAARWGRIPRAYIECSDDNALPLAHQRRMQAALPCDPVVTIDSGHSPFLSAPRLLADTIERIAEDLAAKARANQK